MSACGQREPYATSCDTETGECEEYATKAEMLEASREERLSRKRAAQRLFVDYREPVFAVLKKYLGDYRDPKLPHRIYVSIFDEDIDQTLRSRLADAGINVEPGWGCNPSGSSQHAARAEGAELICINIPDVKSIGDSKYQFTLNHYEKTYIDHFDGSRATVQLQGDHWEMLELTAW